MPMHQFRGVGVVEKIDSDHLVFLQSDHRARHLTVIADRAERVFLVEFNKHGSDAQCQIGLAICLSRAGRNRHVHHVGRSADCGSSHQAGAESAGQLDEITQTMLAD